MSANPHDVALCKLQIANCERKKTPVRLGALEAQNRRSSLFTICNWEFAYCNAFLLLFCGVLFFYRLADRDLWNSHEGRAGQDAQSLLASGDWGMPRLFDGRPEMQKPPLYYWLVGGVAWLRGGPVDAWAVRLPAALAAMLCVLGLYAWGYRRGRPLAGFLAAVILATAVHFTWLARVGRIDMPLALAVGFALLAFYHAGKHRVARLILAYLALAAGILLKGPIALALPAVVITVHLILEKELPLPWQGRAWRALLNRLGFWWGLPLVAVVTAPWFVWANAATQGEWFQEFFWRHNVERGFGGGSDPEGHWNHPWWLYGPMFLWDFLPWSIFLPLATWYFGRNKSWRSDAEARFGLIWLVSMVLVLSCMRFKRSDYLLPAYPGAAIFLGCVAERWCRDVWPRLGRVRLDLVRLGFGLIVLGCGVGWLINAACVIPEKEPTREYRAFAEQIRAVAPTSRVAFFRNESHALVFHVGQPIDLFVEWEKLDALAGQPEPAYVVMPAKVAQEWPQHLTSGRLEEIARNTPAGGGTHEKPLVLLRTRSNHDSDDP
jgi:4-amino-4-deoxy-L-arabinose transferase-like glycosyltransferase